MKSIYDTLAMIILFTTFFAALVLVVFILAKYSYLSRKAFVDAGKMPAGGSNRFIYQDIACIVLGIGAGLGFSSIITVLNLSEGTMDLLIYSTILIFGGIGLLVAHHLRKRR